MFIVASADVTNSNATLSGSVYCHYDQYCSCITSDGAIVEALHLS